MIILDTDFLVNSVKYKIDFTKKLKENFPKKSIYIIDKTLDELEKINNLNAKTALKLIKIKKFNVIKTKKDKTVDELILEIVEDKDIVATQDKELKRKLKNKRIKVITVRQKKYVSK